MFFFGDVFVASAFSLVFSLYLFLSGLAERMAMSLRRVVSHFRPPTSATARNRFDFSTRLDTGASVSRVNVGHEIEEIETRYDWIYVRANG